MCYARDKKLDRSTIYLGMAVDGSRFRMRDGRVLAGLVTVNAPGYDVHIPNGQIEVKRISE